MKAEILENHQQVPEKAKARRVIGGLLLSVGL